MRKNSARKWLHATLDLLPVVIIPIFALYATNKNATFAQEITVEQNKAVDFNQLIDNGNFINNRDWQTYQLDNNFVIENNTFSILDMSDTISSSQLYKVPFSYLKNGDILIFKCDIQINNNYRLYTSFGGLNVFSDDIINSHYEKRFQLIQDSTEFSIYINYFASSNTSTIFNLSNVNVFNLTQMFGAGNEPTIEEFNEWYPNAYYDYTLSEKQLLKDYNQITYNDTDIGSQFIYGLYNSVDKYFNIGNVFNLGSIYDWLNLNIFNGNSPIAIYIVWNIVAYEFLMDLLFLLYGLFMFFIDTCTNLMDRFYCNLSGRR